MLASALDLNLTRFPSINVVVCVYVYTIANAAQLCCVYVHLDGYVHFECGRWSIIYAEEATLVTPCIEIVFSPCPCFFE